VALLRVRPRSPVPPVCGLLAELLVPAITLSATAAAPEPSVLIVFGWIPTLGTAILLAVVPVLAAALVMLRRPDAAADLRAAEAA
jgi:hypothetical protein